MKFVLASHNKGKLAEMQAILGELGVEVVMPADVGVDIDVEETGTTFAENAGLKAQAIMQASGFIRPLKTQTNLSCIRKFTRISQEIRYHLHDTVLISLNE